MTRKPQPRNRQAYDIAEWFSNACQALAFHLVNLFRLWLCHNSINSFLYLIAKTCESSYERIIYCELNKISWQINSQSNVTFPQAKIVEPVALDLINYVSNYLL